MDTHDISPTQKHISFLRGPFLRRLLTVLGAVLVFLILIYVYVLPWAERWGATDAELATELPGDTLVIGPATQTTKAITIQASPEQVWAWLVQLGVDRGGMYSYDGLENLLGLKVKSTDSIHPEWQGLTTGDFIRFTPPDYFIEPGPGVWVVLMQEEFFLVGCFGVEDQMPQPCTGTWQFVLSPRPDGATRLILRSRGVASPGLGGQMNRLFSLISFGMERKMLLGIQERAEVLKRMGYHKTYPSNQEKSSPTV
jgi:hypothetical protein